MTFYAIAHALQDVNTAKMIQEYIIAYDPFPTQQIVDFALDTIKYQMEGIKPQFARLISENFTKLMKGQLQKKLGCFSLPYFKAILENENLNCENEDIAF